MTKEYEMRIYDKLDDIWTKLEHLKGDLYENDNKRADRNCSKIFECQKIITEVKDEYTTWAEDL